MRQSAPCRPAPFFPGLLLISLIAGQAPASAPALTGAAPAAVEAPSGRAAAAGTPDGGALFETHCAACHLATAIPRALAIGNMRALPPEAIVGALTDGAMREQGAALSQAERQAISEFITGSARDGSRRRDSRRRPPAPRRRRCSGRGRTAARSGTAGGPE